MVCKHLQQIRLEKEVLAFSYVRLVPRVDQLHKSLQARVSAIRSEKIKTIEDIALCSIKRISIEKKKLLRKY